MTGTVAMEEPKVLGRFPKRAQELRQEACDIARELVRLHGGKLAAACDDLARTTGLSARRIRSHCHGEPVTLAAHEIEALRQAMLDAMEAEERRAAHRAAIWRVRLGYRSDGVAPADGELLV